MRHGRASPSPHRHSSALLRASSARLCVQDVSTARGRSGEPVLAVSSNPTLKPPPTRSGKAPFLGSGLSGLGTEHGFSGPTEAEQGQGRTSEKPWSVPLRLDTELPPYGFSARRVPSIEFECPGNRQMYVYSLAAGTTNVVSTDWPGEASVVQPSSFDLRSIGT